MSTSQKKLYFYSSEGLALVKPTAAGATTLLRAAGRTLAQRDDGQAAFYAVDVQGSVLVFSSCSLYYTVYGHDGEVQCASVLHYSGQRKESATGHYLLGDGYRAFSPVLMRFNAPDSMSPFGNGGLNVYCYCNGDPVNKVDPSGHVGDSFVSGGLFTRRWGLRSVASYALGKNAPALKPLKVKKALSEFDPHLRARVSDARRHQSWQPKDVKRLENSNGFLQGRANRFELAEEYFNARNYVVEAEAAAETRKEIVRVQQWVTQTIKMANKEMKRTLFEELPFSLAGEMTNKRNGG
ncbi:RHS repeat-associated core domain-containing protein [Pseudomonas sp. FGI182]|uniref:RHS repeat-associated core domain-containing protein n=1 Tax=Pseudomonas sp. FGI182 TaxID=1259844 RepID=UPI0009DD5F8C|nr:RHS repeat-associated core domain-containing protein [Pseudomonas sp. FGI182]